MKWVLGFQIALSSYSYLALAYIKTQLGIGTIGSLSSSNMIQYRIRNRGQSHTLPIFDRFPMISAKRSGFLRVKKAYKVLENHLLDSIEQETQLVQIYQSKKSWIQRMPPVWEKYLGKSRIKELKDDQFSSLRMMRLQAVYTLLAPGQMALSILFAKIGIISAFVTDTGSPKRTAYVPFVLDSVSRTDKASGNSKERLFFLVFRYNKQPSDPVYF